MKCSFLGLINFFILEGVKEISRLSSGTICFSTRINTCSEYDH